MRFINRVIGWGGGLAIAAMMLLIVAEVLSRLVLDRSIEGAIEVVCMCLALSVFLGLSPGEEKGDHVRMELLRMRLGPGVRGSVDLAVSVLALVTVAVITWQVGLDAWSSLRVREVLPGARLQVPVYPAKIAAFLGFFIFLLQLARTCSLRVWGRESGPGG